jgi:hypothetical protein
MSIGVGLLLFAVGCSGFRAATTKPNGTGGAGAVAGGGGSPGGAGGGGGNGGGSAGSGATGGTGGSTMPIIKCDNLSCYQSTCRLNDCKQPACTNGKVTRIIGKVFDPAGKVPLYNVDVYDPNKPLPDFTDGPSCEACTSRFPGSPVVRATTDTCRQFHARRNNGDVPGGCRHPLSCRSANGAGS